tara:strand:+ start:1672 stop:2466 length:795 start_codon:yes stop_codon:yes gene_type:complete
MALTLRGNGHIASDNYTIDSDGDITNRHASVGGNAAVSGTLGVTGATTFSGDVGIGGIATDPSWSTQLYGNREVSIDGGGGYGVLHFRGDGAGSTNTRYSMGAGDGNFYMAYDDVTTVHRMTINSSGHVTKPSQPHMLAQGYHERYGTTDRHLFRTVTTNNGNHWNNTNGKFTCPTAGTYLVTAFSGYKETSNYAGIGIGYNGSVLSYGWSPDNDARHGHQNVTIMKNASANDYFYYYAHTSYTTPIAAAGNEHHAHFSVYLLG